MRTKGIALLPFIKKEKKIKGASLRHLFSEKNDKSLGFESCRCMNWDEAKAPIINSKQIHNKKALIFNTMKKHTARYISLNKRRDEVIRSLNHFVLNKQL